MRYSRLLLPEPVLKPGPAKTGPSLRCALPKGPDEGSSGDPDGALWAGKFTTAVKMALSVKMAGGVESRHARA